MKLSSLKEVLLKKSEGNQDLQTLIEYMGADVLANSVVESLAKMAKMGRNANMPTRKFGRTADTTDMVQLRDAIGHHLGHYKAALKAHHAAAEDSPEKTKYRQIADQHIEQALPLLHLAGKSAYHSGGKSMLKYPSMMPWEANYTSMKRSATGSGRLHRDPKGLSSYTVKAKGKRGAGEDGYGITDFRYFEMPPNPGHPKVKGMTFTGGYPWEEIQFGRPEDVDAKKAYLDIPDVSPKTDFAPHAFDKHPLAGMHKISHEHTSEDMKNKYASDLAAFRGSPEHETWLNAEEEKEKADPEYGTKPTPKGNHFYDGMSLLPQRPHVNDHPHVVRGAPSEENWEIEQSDPSAVGDDDDAPSVKATPTASAVSPKVRKKVEATTANMEAQYNAWKTLPPQHQKTLLSAIPGLAAYVTKKKFEGGQ
jgi:hypothetical protein